MATAAALRSVLRSPTFRSAVSRVPAASGASRPSLRLPTPRRSTVAARFLRSPVETSFCVESLMPMHSATASALMTSMLSVTRSGYGRLSEDG